MPNWNYLSHDSQTLCPTLSEENGCAWLKIFWSIHKLELDVAFVSSPKQVSIHVQYLGCLPNDTAVYNCLVVRFDGRSVMQDDYLGFEVEDGLRVGVLVSKDHALSESCALQLQFLRVNWLDVEADSLSGDGTVHWRALVMNGLNHYLVELACLVWTKQEHSVRYHCS